MRLAFVPFLVAGSGLGLCANRAWAGDACPAPVSEAELSAILDRADLHFASLEADKLGVALVEADAAVACLRAVISPGAAAHLHRVHGLSLELSGDTDGRQRAFASAIAADSKYRFPPAVLAPKNPAAKAYLDAARLDRVLQPVPAPAPDVVLFWDGAEGGQRPTAAPTVMQVRWGPTELTYSGLLQPTDPLPGYPQPASDEELVADGESALDPVEMPTDQEARRTKITRVSLMAGGGGLLLVGGGATIAAVSNRAAIIEEFFGENARVDPEGTPGWYTFEDDLAAARRRQSTLVGTAIGAGALGAAALTLGVTWTW